VKTRKHSHKVTGKHRHRTGKAALPALVAAGSGLAVGSAVALELGDLNVQSTLGQPLRASIAYALSPNEMIDERCVAIRAGGRDLPGLHNATVRVSKGLISISGPSPVTEPMLSATVVIDCPYAAHVSRNYMMFINPQDRPLVVARQAAPATVVATAPASRTTVAPRAARTTTPVSPDSRYLVKRGDSLLGIVERIEKRGVPTADAMTAILDANPDAFIGGSPDRLKAGSWLSIPSFAGGVATASSVPAPIAPATPAEPQEDVPAVTQASAGAAIYEGAETLEQDARKQIPATEFMPDVQEPEVDPTVESAPDASEEVANAPAEAADSEYSAAYADLVAGDVVVEEPAAVEQAPAEPAAAPARVVKPAAGTRIVGSPQPTGFSWNWLIWAAVALISAFGSYLMFWPRLRERFGSKPVGADDRSPQRSEHSAPDVAPISVPESEMTVQEIKPTYDNVDFDLSDDSPTEENLALDADLVDGTGLEDSDDVDVNRDFGFAATMDLDMELPEMAAADDPSPETDIIPPPERPEEDLVVNSEVLPDDDGDEYDISMIVDATKMPDPAEVTERDLKAVPLDDTGQTLINDDYTIDDEIAQDILEQDYEDELSATQLPHAEIEKAASELAETIGDEQPTEVASLDEGDEVDDNAGRIFGSEDDTSIEMRLTNLSELDLTATLEAQNDDSRDDLDLTASIDVEDKTVEMPRDKDGARSR
jgi:hypothetical protein